MLLAVYALIRRDLGRVERLAAQALDGLRAEDVRQELHEIKRGGTLWRLQVNCSRYCSFVHLHHNAEDADFFSELRDTNADINPVIDRLQAEHGRVSDELDTSRPPPMRSNATTAGKRAEPSSRPSTPYSRTCSPT